MEDENLRLEVTDKPRKRPKIGRKREQVKKAKLTAHKTGENCKCTRFKCFESVSENERSRIIAHFNSLPTKNEQDCFLGGLVKILPVKRRRSRKTSEPSFEHDFSCEYSIIIERDGNFMKVPVCLNAFCAIFGISKGRIRRVRENISNTGMP